MTPDIHFVPIKTTEQQDIKAWRNTRQLMVEQRTALANQLRSMLAEYGLIIPVGIQRLQQQLPGFIEDDSNDLTFRLRRLLFLLREDMQALNERVACLDNEIAELSSQQTAYRHLLTIPASVRLSLRHLSVICRDNPGFLCPDPWRCIRLLSHNLAHHMVHICILGLVCLTFRWHYPD